MPKGISNHLESLESGPNLTQDDVQKANHVDSSELIANLPLARKVVRKIDMMVIPFICITYLVTYIDKAMLGYSAVFGLKDSLSLHGSQYSWLGKSPFSMGPKKLADTDSQ